MSTRARECREVAALLQVAPIALTSRANRSRLDAPHSDSVPPSLADPGAIEAYSGLDDRRIRIGPLLPADAGLVIYGQRYAAAT